MKNKVIIGDVPCWWTRWENIKYPMERICPICNKEINKFVGRIHIINNYILFPNISCHLDCFSEDKAEETIVRIKDNYEQSKAALEKALADGAAWFSHIKEKI